MTKDNVKSLDAARLKRVAKAAQRSAASLRRLAEVAKRKDRNTGREPSDG